MRHTKIRERKGPSQGVMQKCVLQERIPSTPKFEERTQDETLKQERCARRDARDLAKDVYKLKKGENRSILLSGRILGNAATLFNKSRRARIRDRFRSVYAHAEQKGCKLR